MPDNDDTTRENRFHRLVRIGRAIEEHRGSLTQVELAQEAGVALNTVALLERGKQMPWPQNRRKIETALGWPTGTLTAMLIDGAPAPPLRNQPEAVKTDTRQVQPPQPPSNATAPLARTPAAVMLNIALDVALEATTLVTTCSELVSMYGGSGPDTAAAIAELDRLTQSLEATVAAAIPAALQEAESGELVDQLIAVLTEMRRSRQRAGVAGTD